MRFAYSIALLALVVSFVTGRERPVGPGGEVGEEALAGRAGEEADLRPGVRTASTAFSITLAPDARGAASLAAPALTPSALERGAVYAYVRFSGEPSWWPLPCSVLGDGAFFHRAVLGPGTARIDVRRSGGERDATLAGSFRVVAVEEGDLPRSSSAEPPPYEELAARYDLPFD